MNLLKLKTTIFNDYYDQFIDSDWQEKPSLIPNSLVTRHSINGVNTAFFDFFYQDETLHKFFLCFEAFKGQCHGEEWSIQEEINRITENEIKKIFYNAERHFETYPDSISRLRLLRNYVDILYKYFQIQNFQSDTQKSFLVKVPGYLTKVRKLINDGQKFLIKKYKHAPDLSFQLPRLQNQSDSNFTNIHRILFTYMMRRRRGNSVQELFDFLKSPNTLTQAYNWEGTPRYFLFLIRMLNDEGIISPQRGFWDLIPSYFIINGKIISPTFKNSKAGISVTESNELRSLRRSFTNLKNI